MNDTTTDTTTGTVELVIGRTLVQRAAPGVRTGDYVPMCDGYREGAKQTTVTLTVAAIDGVAGERWADAVFVATNAPGSVVVSDDATMAVHDAIVHGVNGQPVLGVPVLSVGDTVTVDGVRYACAPVGWERR
jgi:hypothetical protein